MDECLTMAGDKTAALMACACSIGAIFTGAPPSLAMSLADFGSHTGLAFQLVDDLLGIWGAPEVTGKPVWSDLRTRKKTLPVVAALVGLQDGQGWWKGELETNVTMDAEDLLMREFLGVRAEEDTQAAARWIRSKQRRDGTWANFHGGPPDLSTTVEAYVALRLAGDLPASAHMAAAAAFNRDGGGIAATRVFTRILLAMVGEWPWPDPPVLPPEMGLL